MIAYVSDGDRLLLGAAFARTADGARQAWHAWRAAGGDIQLVPAATIRILTLVGRNLARHGVDDRDLGRLRGLQRHGFIERTRVVPALSELLAALAATGVGVIVSGGVVNATLIHHEHGLAPSDDTALLVRPRQVPAALAALRAARCFPTGTHAPTLRPALEGRRNLADEGVMSGLALASRGGLSLTLGWALEPRHAGPESDAQVWSRAHRSTELECAVLAGEDALLQALAVPGPPLERLARVLALARSPGLDVPAFAAEAARRGLATTLRAELRAIAAVYPEAIPVALTTFATPDRTSRPTGALDGREPIDAARVLARSALHRFAATPAFELLRVTTRPLRLALRHLRGSY